MKLRKRCTPFIIGASAALLISACQFNSSDQQTQNPQPVIDTLVYKYEDYIKFSKHIIKTSETTDTSFFSVSYPVFEDSAVNLFVQKSLLGTDTTTVEKAAETFIGEFDDFYESDPFPRIWTSESHVGVYRITPSYLSLDIKAYTYTGGAHGNYATIFDHYDLQARKPLTLDDIVPPSFQNELTAVGERYFRVRENLGINQSLEDNYFFDDGRFSLPNNFAIERDSMLFLYNIYEIKPYVYGQTELRVPHTDIEGLLTDRAKLIIAELNTKVKP